MENGLDVVAVGVKHKCCIIAGMIGALTRFATLLAGRGVTAAQIADHCGISVAEAELVCALARAEDGA